MEKVSALAKDTRIKALEDLVIKVGYDPTNIDAVEELMRKENTNIAALRKQLKLPATEDPLAKDNKETETQKADMMKLIMEQSAELKQMEIEMEKIIKKGASFQNGCCPFRSTPYQRNSYSYIFYNKNRGCCRSVGKCSAKQVSRDLRNQNIAGWSQSSLRSEDKEWDFLCSRATESSKPNRNMEEINNWVLHWPHIGPSQRNYMEQHH